MSLDIHLQPEPSRITAVIRVRTSLAELPIIIPPACGEVWAFIRANNLPSPGLMMAFYRDMEINLECGALVDEPFTGNERVVCSCTPAGQVATAAYLGPYQGLPAAHAEIHEWCRANGHRRAGPCWEIYGHWTDDQALLRTDIYYLLNQ